MPPLRPDPRRTSSTTLPTPLRMAFCAPIALAQKPSICPSSSALAAATPNETPRLMRARYVDDPNARRARDRCRSRPAVCSKRQFHQRRGADGPALHRIDVAGLDIEIGHASPAANRCPATKRREAWRLAIREMRAKHDVRGPRDEVDLAVPQGLVGLVVGKDQPVLRVEPFLGEEPSAMAAIAGK